MDLRGTAAITVDLQPTFCPRANWAGVTTEETVMSLSSCKTQRRMLTQLSPLGGRRGHLISFQREGLNSVDCTAARWIWRFCALSPSLANRNKNCGFCYHLCVDGYYKLTGINGKWLEHYFSRQSMILWLEMFQVLEVFLIHLIRHLKKKKPQSWACVSEIKRFKVL